MSLYLSNAWQPPAPYARPVVFDAMAARPYVPLDDDAVRSLAMSWLRDIAARVQGKARRDVIWTSTADRDLTGAFPVVAVA